MYATSAIANVIVMSVHSFTNREDRQHQAHREGRGGETREDESDRVALRPMDAVDRHDEHEEVPRTREQSEMMNTRRSFASRISSRRCAADGGACGA